MLKNKKIKAELYEFQGVKDSYEKLRYLAASKLLTYKEHTAGKGSVYIFIGELKIRISDHEETSINHRKPDFNLINRDPNENDIKEIESQLSYPKFSKQMAFSICVGQTIPKLKKILSADCYMEIVENEFYSNTTTKVIIPEKAFKELSDLGINERNAVRQESYSYEDYAGF